jgi:hypothetical protein
MMGIYGQDWASYQSAQPDVSGLSFAFVKITEGLSYINPLWKRQRDHAKANGLVWGAYHYPNMHNSDRAEADFFLAQNQWQPGDLVVLDWEGYDAANATVSAADQLAYKEGYLQYVKSRLPHNPVGLYCNTDYWNRVDTTGHRGDFLWIATAGRAAGDPGIAAQWLFHQYSDAGVDRDFSPFASTAALRTWALGFATPIPAQPQETDMLDDATIALWNGMIWGLKNTTETTQRQISQLQQQMAAQQATITTLAGLLSAQHPGVDTAQVVAAVDDAIAKATVHVTVTDSVPPPAAAVKPAG